MNRPLDFEALRDYWRVYSTGYERIVAEATAPIAGHPVFGPILAATPPEVLEAQRKQSLELTRATIFEGKWDEYAATLRTQGETYARMGLPFESWYDIVRVYQRVVIGMLVKEFATDLDRMTRVLVAAQDFLDRAMAEIAKAYSATKEGAIAAQRELAERRAAEVEISERAVQRQSALLRAVLDSIPDGVVVVDEKGDYTLTNRAATEIMSQAVTAASDITTAVFDVATGEPVGGEDFPTRRAARGERFDDLELLRTRVGGADQVISSRGRPLTGEAGLRGGVVCFRDVTERKKVEALQAHSDEVEAENRRIHTANRMKSEFLANMSHELRTPLNAIIGFSELLVDDAVEPGTPEYRGFLNDILSSGRHLLDLINEVLDLSKVEAGKIEFQPQALDPAGFIEDVVALLRTQARAKNIRLETDLDPSVGDVSIDPGRFKQVLYNFVSNALKFTRDGGRIIVRLRPEAETTFRVEVEDNGIGIAPEDLPRLFVEFEQIRSSGKAHAGTGLGLALSRRLVEAQGGYAGATSVLGAGSTFFAVLPRRATNSFQLPERFVRRGAKPDAPCVLVVEDDPRDQAFLVRTLTTAGYAIETVASATQALESLRARRFDAVTLDVLLPDASGLDLLREIRRDPAHAKIPVVVVTVSPDRAGAAGLAVDEYLMKPIDAPALLDALGRLGIHAERGSVLVVDDDPAALRLMQATLEQAGYRAICESDAERALELCLRTPPAAAIVDLLMPRVDGFEFIDRLRRIPSLRHVPVIVWSAKTIDAEEHARLRTRADAIVRKGSAATLLDELRALMPVRDAG